MDNFLIEFSLIVNGSADTDCLLRYSGKIVPVEEDHPEEKEAGGIDVLLVRPFESGYLYDELDDAHNQEMFLLFGEDDAGWNNAVYELYPTICSSQFLILDKIELQPEFRGNGLGAAVVKRVIDTLGQDCGLIALRPFPIQWTGAFDPDEERDKTKVREYNRDLAKIRKYWSKLGFRQARGTNVYTFCPELTKQPPPRKHMEVGGTVRTDS